MNSICYSNSINETNRESTTLKIPIGIITKSKKINMIESAEFDKRQVLADSDTKPLILPSEQDCTKSSSSYIDHSVSIDEDLKVEKKHSIYSGHELILITNNLINEKKKIGKNICHLQKTNFLRHSDLIEIESTSNEPNSDDKEQKFNRDKTVENNYHRKALNNSLKTISSQVKQQLKSVCEENCHSQSVPQLSSESQNSSNENESDDEINNDSKIKKIYKSKRLRNNRRKIALNYSLEVISDQMNEDIKIIKNERNESSDDTGSVQFSQVFVNVGRSEKNGSISNINTSKVLHNSLTDNLNGNFVTYRNEFHRSHSIHFSETCMHSNKKKHVDNNYTTQEIHNTLVNNGSESDSDGSIVFSNNCSHNASDDDNRNDNRILPSYIDASDSDESIVFSESYIDNHRENNEKFCKIIPNFKIDFDESDSSDDSIEFLETYLNKKCDDKPLTDYGFVNPCFEDNDFLLDFNRIKIINNNWSISMKDISSEPREAKKVSFLPLPDLVSVQTFEPDEDGYCYSLYVLDQIRFKNLIADIETMLTPYLTKEYRAKFYQKNYLCEK